MTDAPAPGAPEPSAPEPEPVASAVETAASEPETAASEPTNRRPGRLELGILVAILLLAALTRLPGIAERGRWDADQGTDMRVLRALVVDGEVPLLGPRTSIGTFHHGAVYYYLLAPAAFASAADPVAVTGMIALFGIGAVAAIWWLGRLMGGPLAAALAGLLAAVSPAGIDESTFIWNPNLIPAAAALAYVGAVLGWRTGRARWWLLSGTGAMVTMQCHVLGVAIVLPLVGAWIAALVRQRRAGEPVEGTLRGGAAAVLVIVAGYVPLLLSELQTGFAETQGILDYVAGGGREAAMGVGGRIVTVGLRSITWPLSGLLTDRLVISMVTALAAILLGTLAVLGPRPRAPRWLVAAFGVSVVLLAVLAPSLAVIIPELPNDHYHAFLDPIVLSLVAVGLVRLATALPGGLPGRAAAALGTGALVVIAVTAWPPATAHDGGWPLADDAAARAATSAGDDEFLLVGIPPFKNDNALRFPLERQDAPVIPTQALDLVPGPETTVVVVCDPLFDDVVGAPCGGPAEDAWLSADGRDGLDLVDRFEAGPRRTISVYAAP